MKLRIISTCIFLLFSLNSNTAYAEVEVQGDQELGGYRITGEIFLDNTFTGSTEAQVHASTCQGCSWAITSVCHVEDPFSYVSFCGGGGGPCLRLDGTYGLRMKVWRKLGVDEPWLALGLQCIGEKGPSTPKSVVTTLQEESIEYLPSLIPTTQPANDVLVNTEVFLLSNQVKNFGPREVIVAGIPILLTASANWQWKFSDGTVINTTNPGSGYPNGSVRYVFSTSGLQNISVITTWNATWQLNSEISLPVSGESLTQISSIKINAHEARGVLIR